MKISKLFHWLYGVVMLLPIFAIGSTVLVNTFNKKVTQETQSATINYKYETNDISIESDLVVGNAYHFSIDSIQLGQSQSWFACSIINFYDFDYNTSNTDVNMDEEAPDIDIGSGLPYLSLSMENGYCFWYILYPSDTSYVSICFEGDIAEFVFEFDFVLVEKSDYLLQDFQQGTNLVFSSCENIPIESVDIVTIPSNTNDVFYYAIERVTQSPYFSWAYDSFLVAPFSYIVGLFSMPTNSPVVMLMSYWLAISIIWLVFDLVMYVPLLVHRWLDKGAIQ